MDCPVCLRLNVPSDLLACPQCDTDLQGLRLLENLRISATQPALLPSSTNTTAPTAAKRPAWTLPTVVGLMMLAIGVVTGQIGFLPNALAPAKPVVAEALPDALSVSAVYKDSLVLLRRQITTIQGLKQGDKATSGFVYVVRQGDTLRGIAWRLYGRAELAEQLRELNQIADPRRLPVGKPLRLMSI